VRPPLGGRCAAMGGAASSLTCCRGGPRDQKVAPEQRYWEEEAFLPPKEEHRRRSCCAPCVDLGYGVLSCLCCCGCGCLVVTLWIAVFLVFLSSVPGALPTDATLHLKPADPGKRVCKESLWTPSVPEACGGRAWVSQKALDQAAQDTHELFERRMLAVVERMVDNITNSAPMSFCFGTLSASAPRIDMLSMGLGSVSGRFVQGRGVELNLQGVQLAVDVHYNIESPLSWHPLAGAGQVNLVSGKGTGVKVILDVGAKKGLPVFSIAEQEFFFDVNATVETSWSGGFIFDLFHRGIRWILTTFSNAIQGTVERVVSDLVIGFVNNDVPVLLAESLPLAGMNLSQTPPNNCWALDISVCNLVVEGDYLVAEVRGAMIDVARPELMYREPPLPLPAIRQDKIEQSMASIAVTKWVVDSAMWVAIQGGLAQQEFLWDSNIVHDFLSLLFPDVKLGMTLGANPDAPYAVSFYPGGVALDASIEVKLINAGDEEQGKAAVDLLKASVPANVRASLEYTDNSVAVALDRVRLGALSLQSQACRTVWGQRCVLPFTYKGKSYDQCTSVDTTPPRPWCATKVDEGNYIEGEYGTCGPICATVQSLVFDNINTAIDAAIKETLEEDMHFSQGSFNGLVMLVNTQLDIQPDAAFLWTDFDLTLGDYLDKLFPAKAPEGSSTTQGIGPGAGGLA